MRFFEPEELEGALVVDSEGLVHGRVGGVRFTERGALLQVYVAVRAHERAVDVEQLASTLKARRVEVGEDWALELLVRRAREEGLEVPTIEVEREVRLLKSEVGVEEVAQISVQEVESPSTGAVERVVIILLSTPREAEYRGRKLPPPIPPPLEEEVRGKLCISFSSGILGYVERLVVGAGALGLRVCRKRGVPAVSWATFLSRVREVDEKLYRELSNFKHPLKHATLRGGEVEEARRTLSSLASREVVELFESMVQREGGMVYVDVPWSRVKVVREVVLVE